MTPTWKQAVLDKLESNAKEGKLPDSPAQLAAMLRRSNGKPADKAGITRTLKSRQTSSSFVDAICELLEIAPPLTETSDDPDLAADLDFMRSLSKEARKEIIAVAKRMVK